MVGGFHGVLLLSAERTRSLVWWEDTLRPAIRRTIKRPAYSAWFDDRISPYFCRRPVATASVRQESLTRYILRLRIVRGRNLERRHFGRRHWGIGKKRAHLESLLKDMQRKRWRPKTVNILYSRSGQAIWRRSGSENIHFNPGQPRPRRRTRKSSRRIRRVFFNPISRLIAGWWWSKRWFLVHFREPHESNCTCREKNHSQFQCDFWKWPGLQVRHWM